MQKVNNSNRTLSYTSKYFFLIMCMCLMGGFNMADVTHMKRLLTSHVLYRVTIIT
jgi:hypothetical protein